MIIQPRHHVASGSYFVGESQSLVLEAYLGTCVGVVLYDSETRIGALSHLLLPEALSSTSCFEPQKYAATGLPLCLNDFYNAGAQNLQDQSLYRRRGAGGPFGRS